MPDIIIKLSEKGVQSVDATLTPNTSRETLSFLEQIFPELEQLNLAAQFTKENASK